MEMPRFNIPSALAMLYGIARPITFPGMVAEAEEKNPGISFAGVRVVEDAEERETSHIGTPIFLPITLEAGRYKTYDSRGKVIEAELDDLRLPISSVVEMSTAKTIVTTQVSASGSSVKEVFKFGEWDIRISGILFDEQTHPQRATTVEKMEHRMRVFDNLADSIGVESKLLNRRGVHRLVIKSLNFQQMPGRPRMMGYQMQCESDAPVELLIQ